MDEDINSVGGEKIPKTVTYELKGEMIDIIENVFVKVK